MNAPSSMKGKASLREVTEVPLAPAKVRAKPRAVRRTQAERTALSDARMFDAAMQLIVEQGTHATTLKEVGERAGYSRGLASSRFGSKMYILWFESISSHNEVRDHLAAYHEIYRSDVAHWVEEGIAGGEIDASVDAECYAFGFCSFIFGTIYQWLVAPDNVDLPKQFEAYRRSTAKAFGIAY